jgi:hypothetical protein
VKRNCLQTNSVSGTCRGCGEYILEQFHVPEHKHGFYHPDCWPACAGRGISRTETGHHVAGGPVKTALTMRTC